MITNVLVFDKPQKCEQFKKYAGKSKFVNYICTYYPDEALKKAMKYRPEIIVLGGDVASENFKAVCLWNMMDEWELIKKKIVYISTWDTDEARILKDMVKGSFYLPFSKSLANIVKNRALDIRTAKVTKNAQKNEIPE